MTFPSSTGTLATLSEAWTQARQIAASIKDNATSLSSQSAAGNVGSSQVLRMSVFLRDARVRLMTIKDTPGIGAYVQAQLADQNINIAADFDAMVLAMDNVIAWIVTNFPQSGGFLAAQTIAANGSISDRQFTPAQTANLRPLLDALSATIN